MKLIVTPAFLLTLFVAPAAVADEPSSRTVVETVIAKVNGEIIAYSRFRNAFSSVEDEIGKKYAEDPAEMMKELAKRKETFLDNMIANLLLSQKARDEGITVSDDEVEEVVTRMMLDNGLKTKEDLVLALRSEGIDMTEFKRDLREQGYREKLLQKEIMRKISVTDDEVAAYYQEHPDLFAVSAESQLFEIGLGNDEAAAKESLVKVKAALAKGKTFEEAAKEFSTAPSKASGGNLGWFHKGDLDPAIEQVILRLGLGEVGDLVKTSYGYRIIKLAGRKEASARPLDEVKASIREFLRKRKYNEGLDGLVADLRKQSVIEVKNDEGKLVVVSGKP